MRREPRTPPIRDRRCAMTRPAFVEIDGKLYRWRDLVDDSCPRSQRTAAGRYSRSGRMKGRHVGRTYRPHHLDGHRLPSLYRTGILAPESPWSNIPRGCRGCETPCPSRVAGRARSAADMPAFSAMLSTNQRIPGRLAGYADGYAAICSATFGDTETQKSKTRLGGRAANNRPKPETRDLDNRELPKNQALSQVETTRFRLRERLRRFYGPFPSAG
jgi:hypothetical protein